MPLLGYIGEQYEVVHNMSGEQAGRRWVQEAQQSARLDLSGLLG